MWISLKMLFFYNKISTLTIIKRKNWFNLPQNVLVEINFPSLLPNFCFYRPLTILHLYCILTYNTVLCYTILHTILYCTQCTTLFYTKPYIITLYYTAQYCNVPWCKVQHITPHCTLSYSKVKYRNLFLYILLQPITNSNI